jgi:hypothetical protein
MSIIGYGEDALTYWALSTQLTNILDELVDHTEKKDCTIFYRPSFGRSGGKSRPHFGEFDAILSTKKAVYLIESKWDNVTNGSIKNVKLRNVQMTRHCIFTWLRNKWTDWRGENRTNCDWTDFWKESHEQFKEEKKKPLVGMPNLLARNLARLLLELEKSPKVITNVMLYFHHSPIRNKPVVVNEKGQTLDPPFKLVPLRYYPFGNSGYFVLDPS